MHILMTGATGFIGHHLVKQLGSAHRWTVLSRQAPEVVRERLGLGVECIPNLDNLSSLPPVDMVINLAGEPLAGRWTAQRKQQLWDSRIQTTQQLVNWCKGLATPPQYWLNASAVGVYGSAPGQLTETSVGAGEDFPRQLCLAWEALAQELNQIMPVGIARFGLVLGQDGGVMAKLLPLYRWGLGSPLGSGQQLWSWIHLADAVGALEHLIQQRAAGVYNLTAPTACTNAAFSQALAKACGRWQLPAVPEFALRALWGEGAELVLASQHAYPAALLDPHCGFEFKFPHLDAALADVVTCAAR